MSLDWLPAEPKPPTRRELEDAILAFAEEWRDAVSEGTPGDRAILGLAVRLLKAQSAHRAKSEPVAAEMAPDVGEATKAGPEGEIQPWCEVCGDAVGVSVRHDYRQIHDALRRWVVARDEWARDDQRIEAVNEVLDSSRALAALARSVLGAGEGE